MRGLTIIALVLIVGSTASAAPPPPPSEVFRADTRHPDEISAVGGMFPQYRPGTILDDNLTHHFDGSSLENGRSNFVSTSSAFLNALSHGAFRVRRTNNGSFEENSGFFIYRIRPAENFFNVDYSLNVARANSESEDDRNYLRRRLQDYDRMNEYAARGGIQGDRIISVIYITGQILNQINYDHGGVHYDEATSWGWNAMPGYNAAHDGDTGNPNPYPHVSRSTGITQVVVNETTSAEIPLRGALCYLPVTSTHTVLHNFPSNDTNKHDICPANQKIKTRTIVYGTAPILMITDINDI